MKELFMAYLGKTLNIPVDRLAEILFKKSDDGTITDEPADGVLETLSKLDSERIGKVKSDTKTAFDNGFKKAQADVSQQWEKMIREKFGVDSDKQGEELLDAAFQIVAKPPKSTDDQIKASPLYVALERKYREDLEAATAEREKALEELKVEFQKSGYRNSAKSILKDRLLSRKPNLSKDPAKAEKMINVFLQQFDGYDFEPMDNGFIPMKDGKRVENEHGHPITLETLSDTVANSFFDFQVQEDKGNGGNKNEPGGGAAPVVAPKTEVDLWEAYNKASTQEEKTAILSAFEKEHGDIQF